MKFLFCFLKLTYLKGQYLFLYHIMFSRSRLNEFYLVIYLVKLVDFINITSIKNDIMNMKLTFTRYN